ncbi:MAG TPA: SRPBCC family protein [Acidimicrobiales bacterium]|nr:SRPBCC family protein [Acidimicrobiales bacterium]
MEGDSVTVERVIPAPPEAIFRLLADASQHPRIDGSGTVKEAKQPPQALTLGSTFGMSMRQGVPYSVLNEVVEYEENRRIAWRPKAAMGFLSRIGPEGRVWRYELEPVGEGTRVRETWDISKDRAKGLLRRGRLPERTRASMEKTLERIEQLVT